jgi:hypothetical protein
VLRDRKLLADMLVDMVMSVSPAGGSGFRVTSVHLDLPVEVRLRQVGDQLEIFADLPRWRWSTDFDDRRSRLNFSCGEGDLS